MKLARSIQIAALLLLSVSSMGWADNEKKSPTINMHQRLAGELDENGWTTAVSTEGRFLVRVPTKYNDFRAVHDVPNSVVEHSDNISALTMQAVKFTAIRIHYKPGNSGARAQFEKFKVSAGKLRYKSLKPMKMNGNDALEGEVVTARATMVQRVILLGEDLFMMIVEYPKAQEVVAKRQIPMFFDSVKFD
jgi:hypothetical protein